MRYSQTEFPLKSQLSLTNLFSLFSSREEEEKSFHIRDIPQRNFLCLIKNSTNKNIIFFLPVIDVAFHLPDRCLYFLAFFFSKKLRPPSVTRGLVPYFFPLFFPFRVNSLFSFYARLLLLAPSFSVKKRGKKYKIERRDTNEKFKILILNQIPNFPFSDERDSIYPKRKFNF